MIFSSLLFLFLFLPLTLVVYYSVGTKLKNHVLLLASLFFYAWGEIGYVLLMLFSIGINYLFGILIDRARRENRATGMVLAAGVTLNLLPLAFFKYGNFLVDNCNQLLLSPLGIEPIALAPIHLPIGISFFTFQAISYIVDVYRRQATVQHRPVNLALYIALFPQLIAGPIVRYRDVALQITKRSTSLEDFQSGVQRFVIGLGKKVLIANTVGAVADHVFTLQSGTLPAGLLWLGMICYTLQIYYDFSGYSDMAIGLGRMFGFHFLENFNYPYSASSIQDFWRRWHISLSSWFKDYLYIPLGGNRKGEVRTYWNLLTVFFLCGFWHGASWNFIVWGLYHGMFLVLERIGLGRLLARLPLVFRHCYTILVFSIGWVFFRAETLPQALEYLAGLTHFGLPPYLDAQLFGALNVQFYIALVVGLVFSFPVLPYFLKILSAFSQDASRTGRFIAASCNTFVPLIWIALIVVYSTTQLISGTHNPFLYFRF